MRQQNCATAHKHVSLQLTGFPSTKMKAFYKRFLLTPETTSKYIMPLPAENRESNKQGQFRPERKLLVS